MPEYLVKSATLESEVDFGDGKMNKFLLDLEDENGTVTSDVESWIKTSLQAPAEGDRVTCEITDAKRGGLKTKSLRIVGGFQKSTPSVVAASGHAPARDATGRSIERQVALKAAVEYGAAFKLDADEIITLASRFDRFLENQPVTKAPEQGSSQGKVVADDEDIPF